MNDSDSATLSRAQSLALAPSMASGAAGFATSPDIAFFGPAATPEKEYLSYALGGCGMHEPVGPSWLRSSSQGQRGEEQAAFDLQTSSRPPAFMTQATISAHGSGFASPPQATIGTTILSASTALNVRMTEATRPPALEVDLAAFRPWDEHFQVACDSALLEREQKQTTAQFLQATASAMSSSMRQAVGGATGGMAGDYLVKHPKVVAVVDDFETEVGAVVEAFLLAAAVNPAELHHRIAPGRSKRKKSTADASSGQPQATASVSDAALQIRPSTILKEMTPIIGHPGRYVRRGVYYYVIAWDPAAVQFCGSVEAAHKAVANEVRALKTLLKQRMHPSDFAVPLVTAVDVFGWRVFAAARLPLTVDTHVAGPIAPNAVRVAQNQPQRVVEAVCERLCLSPIYLSMEHKRHRREYPVMGSVELCVHFVDYCRRVYIFEAARLFPACDDGSAHDALANVPLLSGGSAHGGGGGGGGEHFLPPLVAAASTRDLAPAILGVRSLTDARFDAVAALLTVPAAGRYTDRKVALRTHLLRPEAIEAVLQHQSKRAPLAVPSPSQRQTSPTDEESGSRQSGTVSPAAVPSPLQGGASRPPLLCISGSLFAKCALSGDDADLTRELIAERQRQAVEAVAQLLTVKRMPPPSSFSVAGPLAAAATSKGQPFQGAQKGAKKPHGTSDAATGALAIPSQGGSPVGAAPHLPAAVHCREVVEAMRQHALNLRSLGDVAGLLTRMRDVPAEALTAAGYVLGTANVTIKAAGKPAPTRPGAVALPPLSLAALAAAQPTTGLPSRSFHTTTLTSTAARHPAPHPPTSVIPRTARERQASSVAPNGAAPPVTARGRLSCVPLAISTHPSKIVHTGSQMSVMVGATSDAATQGVSAVAVPAPHVIYFRHLVDLALQAVRCEAVCRAFRTLLFERWRAATLPREAAVVEPLLRRQQGLAAPANGRTPNVVLSSRGGAGQRAAKRRDTSAAGATMVSIGSLRTVADSGPDDPGDLDVLAEPQRAGAKKAAVKKRQASRASIGGGAVGGGAAKLLLKSLKDLDGGGVPRATSLSDGVAFVDDNPRRSPTDGISTAEAFATCPLMWLQPLRLLPHTHVADDIQGGGGSTASSSQISDSGAVNVIRAETAWLLSALCGAGGGSASFALHESLLGPELWNKYSRTLGAMTELACLPRAMLLGRIAELCHLSLDLPPLRPRPDAASPSSASAADIGGAEGSIAASAAEPSISYHHDHGGHYVATRATVASLSPGYKSYAGSGRGRPALPSTVIPAAVTATADSFDPAAPSSAAPKQPRGSPSTGRSTSGDGGRAVSVAEREASWLRRRIADYAAAGNDSAVVEHRRRLTIVLSYCSGSRSAELAVQLVLLQHAMRRAREAQLRELWARRNMIGPVFVRCPKCHLLINESRQRTLHSRHCAQRQMDATDLIASTAARGPPAAAVSRRRGSRVLPPQPSSPQQPTTAAAMKAAATARMTGLPPDAPPMSPSHRFPNEATDGGGVTVSAFELVPYTLGLGDGSVPDDALTASSHTPQGPPCAARLGLPGSAFGWQPVCSDDADVDAAVTLNGQQPPVYREWIQVRLCGLTAAPHAVAAISIEPAPALGHTAAYQLLTSLDGTHWHVYTGAYIHQGPAGAIPRRMVADGTLLRGAEGPDDEVDSNSFAGYGAAVSSNVAANSDSDGGGSDTASPKRGGGVPPFSRRTKWPLPRGAMLGNANVAAEASVNQLLGANVMARFVRLVPLPQPNPVALRFELQTCLPVESFEEDALLPEGRPTHQRGRAAPVPPPALDRTPIPLSLLDWSAPPPLSRTSREELAEREGKLLINVAVIENELIPPPSSGGGGEEATYPLRGFTKGVARISLELPAVLQQLEYLLAEWGPERSVDAAVIASVRLFHTLGALELMAAQNGSVDAAMYAASLQRFLMLQAAQVDFGSQLEPLLCRTVSLFASFPAGHAFIAPVILLASKSLGPYHAAQPLLLQLCADHGSAKDVLKLCEACGRPEIAALLPDDVARSAPVGSHQRGRGGAQSSAAGMTPPPAEPSAVTERTQRDVACVLSPAKKLSLAHLTMCHVRQERQLADLSSASSMPALPHWALADM